VYFFALRSRRFYFPLLCLAFPIYLDGIFSCDLRLIRRPKKLILPCVSFLLGASVSVAVDTYYFSPSPSLSNVVITPWSNFQYNVNALNLAEHGLHPFWTHIVVNLPCLLGPALFIPSISSQSLLTSLKQLFQDISFLCSVSGLILLSLRPHQEFRFLLPIIPLLLVSLSQFLPPDAFLSTSSKSYSRIRKQSKPLEPQKTRGLLAKKRHWGWYSSWFIFNLLAGVFMGSLHQSAIVPMSRYLANRIHQTPPPRVCLNPDKSDYFRQTRMIWHRTYPAPDWLFGQPLGDSNTSIEIFNLGGKWDRLWELLGDSAKVPIDQAKFEQENGFSCDAWYATTTNATLQRYSPVLCALC